MTERWATFDCYGTLVDWNGGDRRSSPAARRGRADGCSSATTPSSRASRRSTACELPRGHGAGLAEWPSEPGSPLPETSATRSAGRCPAGRVFPEVPPALAEARERGWRLVALSNSDPDLIEASLAGIGVPFDAAIVASEIGSYKPAHGHWRAFSERGRRPCPPRARRAEPLPRHRAAHELGIARCGSTGSASAGNRAEPRAAEPRRLGRRAGRARPGRLIPTRLRNALPRAPGPWRSLGLAVLGRSVP